MKNQYAVLLIAAVLILGFQNCSNTTSFSGAGELVAKSGSSETDIETILDDTPVNDGDGSPPPSTRPPHQPPRNDRDHANNDEECDDDDESNHANRPHERSPLRFVCVLEGPGHSVKVGFSEGALAGQVGTPRDVCMTENACLNIISEEFDVKAVKQVGFCSGGNPHVVPMTDAEISAALAQAKLVREIEADQQRLQLGRRFN